MGIIKRARVSTAVVVIATATLVVAAAAVTVFSFLKPATTLHIGDAVFKADIAYTQAQREKGLGGVNLMKPDQAMVLAFPDDNKWPIWMKDMKVSIDIVWLDSSKKVVYIVKNAPADGGVDALYVPKSDARYVVELPAGTVSTKNISIGQAVVFDIDATEVKQ